MPSIALFNKYLRNHPDAQAAELMCARCVALGLLWFAIFSVRIAVVRSSEKQGRVPAVPHDRCRLVVNLRVAWQRPFSVPDAEVSSTARATLRMSRGSSIFRKVASLTAIKHYLCTGSVCRPHRSAPVFFPASVPGLSHLQGRGGARSESMFTLVASARSTGSKP